jgi:hypothetical protein
MKIDAILTLALTKVVMALVGSIGLCFRLSNSGVPSIVEAALVLSTFGMIITVIAMRIVSSLNDDSVPVENLNDRIVL